jgi:hypothetical protein
MPDKLRYTELLKKYLEGKISTAEQDELFAMTAAGSMDDVLAQMIEDDFTANRFTEGELPAAISKEIMQKILSSEESTNRLFVSSRRYRVYQRVAVAAVFLVMVLSAAFFYFKPFDKKTQTAFELAIPDNNIVTTNNTDRPLDLPLEDGSKVQLAPHSSLSFPRHFANAKREVFLTGEAFFQVAKNPEKPFLVYYNNIVTRVLGTSFTIKTNNRTKDVEVSVRTGRVQVFENKKLAVNGVSGALVKSVILKPNQKAMYNVVSHDFATTLADSIHPLASISQMEKLFKSARFAEPFIFQRATTMKQIFSLLESVYGVELIVDNENIYKCDFTGDVSTQEMMEKLHIICLAIGATYEVNGTKILVSGKGCN